MSFKYQGKGFVAPTLDETLRPLMYMEAKQSAAEEQYATMQDAASDIVATVESIRKTNPNSAYVKKYDELNSQIENMGTQLSEHGVSPQFTNNFMSTRRNATKLIKPLTAAAERYGKYQDLNYSRKLQDPSLVDLDSTNLENFIDPGYTPKGSVSGEELTKAVLTTSALAKNGIVSNTIKKSSNAQYLLNEAKRGLSKEVVDAIIQNPTAYPEYDAIIKTTLEAQGVPSTLVETNPEAYNKLYKAATLGLRGLYADVDTKLIDNKAYISPKEYAELSIRRQNAANNTPTGTPVRQVYQYGPIKDTDGRTVYVKKDTTSGKEIEVPANTPGAKVKLGRTLTEVPEGMSTQTIKSYGKEYKGIAIDPIIARKALDFYDTNYKKYKTSSATLDPTQVFVKDGNSKTFYFKDNSIEDGKHGFIEYHPSVEELEYYNNLKNSINK